MVKLSHNTFKKINVVSISFLVTVGILLNLSASSVIGLKDFNDNFHYIKRHVGGIILGLIIYNIGKKFSKDYYKKLANTGMLSITATLFLVLTYGVVAGGSRRWIDFGSINFQPSEFAKPIIILFIAYHLSNIQNDKSDFYILKNALGLPALSALLVLLEPDFGTTLTISGIILFQLLFSEIKLRYPLSIMALSPLPTYLAINVMGYRNKRFTIWYQKICEGTDISAELLADECYQIFQSKLAISSGGLFGLGPGTSRARWGSLPNSWTDFVASIAAEEYGFFGLLLLIIGLVSLIISFFGLGLTSKNEFNRLFFVGMGSWVLIQTVFNLGGIVGLLPITGIVLPFVAYGSSAMVSIFIGLTMAYAKDNNEDL